MCLAPALLAACSGDDVPATTVLTLTGSESGDGDPGDGDGDPGDGDGDGEPGDGDGDGEPGDGDGDGDGDPGECQDTEEQCTVDGHQICSDGTWQDDPCPADTFCDDATGACLACACTPGEQGACVDVDNIETCADDCSGFEPADCGDMLCIDDACVPLLCQPSVAECVTDDTFHFCNDLGSDYEPEQDCPPSQVCDNGECVDACALAASIKSNVGCEFWAVDMANQPPRDTYTYAVSVANPSTDDIATVRIWDKRNGNATMLIEDTVDPRDTKVFNLSGAHAGYTSYYNGIDAGLLSSGIAPGYAFRVETSIPVVATQFNPIGGASGITAEASLLLPTQTLGREYLHLAWGLGFGSGSALDVIATEDDTTITIVPHVNTPAGSNGLPAMIAGQPTQIVIDAYDYIQIGVQDLNMEDMLQSLTGSRITADKPVAVFGGHSCANVPDEVISGCDHVEEQIFPRVTWGNNYVAARNPPRANEPMRWRIIASANNTIIDFDPAVSLGAQIMLDSGQMVEFDEMEDFYVSASGPILMAGYMFGCGATPNPCVGDPYMVQMVAVEQYRNDYVFLIDDSYTQDFAKLVRPAGEEVIVECLGPVPDDRWTAIGNSMWEWAVIDMNPGEAMCTTGTNQASSAEGFGLIVSGQATFTSYAYPGGLALEPINNP
jgi:hypothetical protein